MVAVVAQTTGSRPLREDGYKSEIVTSQFLITLRHAFCN